MRLERRGRELWAELDDPDWDGQGAAPPRITRQVVMTTGSHHQQIYWYATGHGRLLGQLPAIRLTADNRWIPRRSAVMHPPNVPLVSESGSWNAVCVSCHTTQGKTALSTPWGAEPLFSQGIDTKAAEFGIACESCHGPASDHIRANGNPARRFTLHLTARADATIVQPLRLDARRSSEVCGQCHGLWEYYDERGERDANANGLAYRPGDVLTKSRFIVQPSTNADSPTMKRLLDEDVNFVRDIFWSDGMARSTGREYNGLIDSPCYRNAKDDQHTLTCFSCHSMHRLPGDKRSDAEWADDQLKPQAQGNGACLQCHTTIAERVTAHTHHAAESSGSSCYNCHMPHTTYGLLKTIRSHQISSPSVQASLATGRPNACNLCHLDKTHQWTADISNSGTRRDASVAWRRRAVGGGVAAVAAQRRRGPARHRRAEHGVGGGAAGVGDRLADALSGIDGAGFLRRGPLHRGAIAEDVAWIRNLCVRFCRAGKRACGQSAARTWFVARHAGAARSSRRADAPVQR